MIDDELQLWYMLSDCVDELRDTVLFSAPDRRTSEFLKLTALQLRLIQTVCRLTRNTPDGIPLKTLAEQLRLSSSAVSLMVANLVKKNELERTPCSRDRRMVLIRMSPRGREAIAKIRESFRKIMKEALEKMPPQDRECAAAVLSSLYDKVRAYTGSTNAPRNIR